VQEEGLYLRGEGITQRGMMGSHRRMTAIGLENSAM
jgi:hypothetical protein